jgi:hypothetical protein
MHLTPKFKVDNLDQVILIDNDIILSDIIMTKLVVREIDQFL